MIKIFLIISSLVSFMSFAGDEDRFKCLTKDERKFVKNVESIQQEHIVSITKTDNNFIMVVFPTAKYLLSPYGFVANMWILADDDKTWEELGPEF